MSEPVTSLRSAWSSGADFLDQYVDRDPPQFFHAVPQDRELPPGGPGALVSVVLAFEDREAEFHVHARVLDRRTGTEKRGLTLEIIPEEVHRMEVILVAARGESLPYRRRRYERIPCELDIELRAEDGTALNGTTTNVNEGGLHASLDDPLPSAGEVFQIEVTVPDRRTWSVRGRVVSAIPDGPQKGVGIEFLFDSAEQRNAIREDCASLRAQSRNSR